MTSSRQTQSFRDFVFDDQSSQFEKIWKNDENFFVDFAKQSSITIIVRRKNRKFVFSIDREIRILKNKIFRFDYKKLQTSRQFQSKRRANVINNTYNAKQVSKSHIHMMRVLHAFNNDENFDFDHISKSLNYREVRKSFHWKKWKIVMKIEMIFLVENKIWELIKRLSERVVITNRWMFKLKYDVNDRILWYKTRWMIHEYKQKKSIDYNVIWVEIVKWTFFKILFALVAERRLHAEQMNIVTIFLYDLLNENVYVTQFEKFVENSAFVYHLIKVLYDLKQAFRVWYEVISAFLKKFDFVIFEANHSVFISKNDKIYVIVYVDDLLIINDFMNFIDFMKQKLDRRFKMIDLDFAQHYLDIEIVRNDDSILFRQIIYLRKVLKRFDMNKCKIVDFLMNSNLTNVMMFAKKNQQTHSDILYWYDSTIESLLYAALMIRSNLNYAFSIISRYCSNSNFTHVATLLRIFWYVQNTLNHDIEYESEQKFFHDYFDADWINSIDDKKSHENFIFFLVDEFISWFFKRQNIVALSNCEFEYYALVETNKIIVWFRQFFMKLSCIVNSESSLIYANNQKAITLFENFEHHKCTKHIINKWHWIRQAIEKHTIQMKYISIALMIANDFTKFLSSNVFQMFLNLIDMIY